MVVFAVGRGPRVLEAKKKKEGGKEEKKERRRRISERVRGCVAVRNAEPRGVRVVRRSRPPSSARRTHLTYCVAGLFRRGQGLALAPRPLAGASQSSPAPYPCLPGGLQRSTSSSTLPHSVAHCSWTHTSLASKCACATASLELFLFPIVGSTTATTTSTAASKPIGKLASKPASSPPTDPAAIPFPSPRRRPWTRKE